MSSSGGLPTVAIIGDSITKYLPYHLPEEFIFHQSAPDCKLEALIKILDSVPPSVKLIIFVVGSEGVASDGIHSCIDKVHLLLGHLRSSRPGAMAVFSSVPPRLPSLHQRYFDPRALGEINVRIRALNHHLWYLSIVNVDVGFVVHREMEWWPEELLASDGIHPNRNGLRLISETLRHVLNYRLGVLVSGELPQTLGATPQERLAMTETHVKTFATVAAGPAGATTAAAAAPGPSSLVPDPRGGPESCSDRRQSTTQHRTSTEDLARYRTSVINTVSLSSVGLDAPRAVTVERARWGLAPGTPARRPSVP
ncbi:unnamed protein product, partial [Ixodes hexagonus]